jgi:hypothetical protein
LRLDADYQLSDALIAELAKLDPNAAVSVEWPLSDTEKLPLRRIAFEG